jgi:transposase
MGIQLAALLGQFDAARAAADELARAAIAHFDQHPDAETITSFPGLGKLASARALAEIGDGRARFADARGLKAFAGSAPITRASGTKTVVLHRHIKNRRLAAVGPIWALGSLRVSPGARRHFDTRRTAGDWNHQAQRHLFNKFLGQLHHCLQSGQHYNEHQAEPSSRGISNDQVVGVDICKTRLGGAEA